MTPEKFEVSLDIRPARREDLPEIVRMLAEDSLGANRDTYALPLADSYYAAFEAIARDENNELFVATLDRVVGTLQLTYIPYLTYRGSWRALIEGVRIDASVRSQGLGTKLIQWAIARAQSRGCNIVQLTSNKSRLDAIRFYQRLGFVVSHEGLKLTLT
jgi:ribosomal protein S18 acetylase RimI-like enzyme